MGVNLKTMGEALAGYATYTIHIFIYQSYYLYSLCIRLVYQQTIFLSKSISLYIYICVCVYICMCACVRACVYGCPMGEALARYAVYAIYSSIFQTI